jgi:hypothetical protein
LHFAPIEFSLSSDVAAFGVCIATLRQMRCAIFLAALVRDVQQLQGVVLIPGCAAERCIFRCMCSVCGVRGEEGFAGRWDVKFCLSVSLFSFVCFCFES